MGVSANIKIPLEKENIVLLPEPKDAEEVIRHLTSILEKKGYVKDSFFHAVLEREASLPTGLELEGDVHAAIPHADVEHVNLPAVGLAVLGKPVVFRCMVEPEKELPVRLVFLLAMNEPKKQVELLQEVAGILQDNELLQRLIGSTSKEEVMDALGILE